MGLTSTIRLAVAKPWRAGISNSTSRVRSPCEQGRVGCFRGRPRRVPGPPFLPESEQGDALSGWVYMAEDEKQYKRLNPRRRVFRSEEHTSELQSLAYLVCRLLLEKEKKRHTSTMKQQLLLLRAG